MAVSERWRLENWCDDPNTIVIVCNACDARGNVMSRNWHYDEDAKLWNPLKRHFPKCSHVSPDRARVPE